mmetsp:Transcript_17130/g.20625  ORF Transcript_17130/g.20625 Transcript_17130/m.20625 type:complete len:324 (-) Transcript_17130:203-1174(-)|eukprot:jgi/Bigna1/89488/estExt_fgenesh1_pg.C_500050
MGDFGAGDGSERNNRARQKHWDDKEESSACPSLQDLLLSLLSEQLEDLRPILRATIHFLPEEVVLKLLSFTLAKGKLDYETAQIFLLCKHESVVTWIKQKVDLFAFCGMKDRSAKKNPSKKRAVNKKSQIVPMMVPKKVGSGRRIIDLKEYINLKNISILNCMPNVKTAHIFNHDGDGKIRSDVDMQMLLTIPFLTPVNLKAISMDASLSSSSDKKRQLDEDSEEEEEEEKEEKDSMPKLIHLFKDRFHMDFDEAQDVRPEMSIEMNKDDTSSGRKFKLKSSRFSSVSCLTIFIESNQSDVDTTFFRRIGIYGTPVLGYSSSP